MEISITQFEVSSRGDEDSKAKSCMSMGLVGVLEEVLWLSDLWLCGNNIVKGYCVL